MTAVNDARIILGEAITKDLETLAAYGDDAALAKAFESVDQLQATITEVVRALVAAQALDAESEADFEDLVGGTFLKSMRAEGARLAEAVASLKASVQDIAGIVQERLRPTPLPIPLPIELPPAVPGVVVDAAPAMPVESIVS